MFAPVNSVCIILLLIIDSMTEKKGITALQDYNFSTMRKFCNKKKKGKKEKDICPYKEKYGPNQNKFIFVSNMLLGVYIQYICRKPMYKAKRINALPRRSINFGH